LGSRTAFLSGEYVGGGRGHGYLDAGQVRAHVLDCDRHGVQGGFHAIGDAAIATVLAGFAGAAQVLGVDRLRAARHRVEHAEILDRRLIRGFVEYGIVASVQPAFDRLWGGAGQMYAQRLGPDRALESNPLGALHAVGVTMAFGSDAPVTPLDPWGAVRAAVCHHNPVQRMSVRAAFAAHTRGGWRAVGVLPGGAEVSGYGVLAPGLPATFAVWDAPGGIDGGLPVLVSAGHEVPDPVLPVCRRTVLRGEVIFEAS
jgi:predicted amidohydrolase YtcJ